MALGADIRPFVSSLIQMTTLRTKLIKPLGCANTVINASGSITAATYIRAKAEETSKKRHTMSMLPKAAPCSNIIVNTIRILISIMEISINRTSNTGNQDLPDRIQVAPCSNITQASSLFTKIEWRQEKWNIQLIMTSMKWIRNASNPQCLITSNLPKMVFRINTSKPQCLILKWSPSHQLTTLALLFVMANQEIRTSNLWIKTTCLCPL